MKCKVDTYIELNAAQLRATFPMFICYLRELLGDHFNEVMTDPNYIFRISGKTIELGYREDPWLIGDSGVPHIETEKNFCGS